MITITSAMKQEEIKKILENYDECDFTFTFKEKKGIKLAFDVTGDKEEAAKKAKEIIKAQPWGSVLFFQAAAL